METQFLDTYVYAIDPGAKTTGIYTSGRHSLQLEILNKSFQEYSWLVCNYIYESIKETNLLFSKVVVIIEDFKLYQHKADVQSFQQMQTAELIGALKSVITSIPKVDGTEIEIVIQSASQAKIWSNDRLLKMGIIRKTGKYYRGIWWDEIIPRHSLDALRHLVYYLNKTVFNKCISEHKLSMYTQKIHFIERSNNKNEDWLKRHY